MVVEGRGQKWSQMLDFGKKEEEERKKRRCLAAQPNVAAGDVSVGDIAEINMIFFTPTSTLLIDLKSQFIKVVLSVLFK